ncbi:recombinase family protein [Robinsoniella peoriensis]|uniref:recombinase family protein n=1 Tax=Robinsoniella peoriensis TaxID=180332 RepID=UPI003750102C
MVERAVYYARVSTEESVQIDALQKQICEAENSIKKHGWILVDRYIDAGKTGTTTVKRDEYNRLYCDIQANLFDIIVIKCEDRLMRNTKDWYNFLDNLLQHGKKLYMYLENKFYSTDDALVTGVRAMVAEEFSRGLSKKINNAHKNRQEYCSNIIITKYCYGFKKENKKVILVEEESKIINQIYDLCISGLGSRSICKILKEQNVKNRNNEFFSEVSIRKVIRNPMYKGTITMNKTHYDFDTKKIIKNPRDQWVIHENVIPPTVDVLRWSLANAEMDKRATVERCKDRGDKIRGYNRGKFKLSSKIICGYCGQSFWRRHRRRYKSNEDIIEWVCSTYCRHGCKDIDKRRKQIVETSHEDGCDNIKIREQEIFTLLSSIADNFYHAQKQTVLKLFEEVLKAVIVDNTISEIKVLEKQENKILKRKKTLMEKLMEELITNDDFKFFNQDYEKSLKDIRNKLNELKNKQREKSTALERINNIQNQFENIYSDSCVYTILQHINHITVYRNKLTIHFDYLDTLKTLDINVDAVTKKVSECVPKLKPDCHI